MVPASIPAILGWRWGCTLNKSLKFINGQYWERTQTQDNIQPPHRKRTTTFLLWSCSMDHRPPWPEHWLHALESALFAFTCTSLRKHWMWSNLSLTDKEHYKCIGPGVDEVVDSSHWTDMQQLHFPPWDKSFDFVVEKLRYSNRIPALDGTLRFNLPFIPPSTRCLHLSDPAGLHLSGTPARRSSLPPQEEETAHPLWSVHSLLCSTVPPPTPGGPEGHFGQYGQHRPRPCHPPLIKGLDQAPIPKTSLYTRWKPQYWHIKVLVYPSLRAIDLVYSVASPLVCSIRIRKHSTMFTGWSGIVSKPFLFLSNPENKRYTFSML